MEYLELTDAIHHARNKANQSLKPYCVYAVREKPIQCLDKFVVSVPSVNTSTNYRIITVFPNEFGIRDLWAGDNIFWN